MRLRLRNVDCAQPPLRVAYLIAMDAAQQYRFPFSVRPTGKILGGGSYGEVLEAEIPGGLCAVKKVHDLLLQRDEGWESSEIIPRKFYEECKVMSSLRHPHIVQFLGVCELGNVPALIMEQLLTDLYSLLDSPTSDIPLGLKFSILRDVAGGLYFLHSQSPPIIHRDLTATNVLLNSAMVAKIADLGMARLLPSGTTRLSEGPGNAAYMPPEAEGNNCVYNESLDVFSFGVLALFTLTQVFPKPDAGKYIKDKKSVSRTEVQRRATFIEQLKNEMKGQGGWLKLLSGVFMTYLQRGLRCQRCCLSCNLQNNLLQQCTLK